MVLSHATIQRVAAISRTADKPEVAKYRAAGVDVRVVDVATATPSELKAALLGVDFIVSVITALALETQRALFAAAKEAGVKRVIPSDFATVCPPGVRTLHDKVGGSTAHSTTVRS